jgi:hypothetical protein
VPYLTCSTCGLSLHSASAYLPYADCPRCARRGRTVALELSPFRLKRTALAGRKAEGTSIPQLARQEDAAAESGGAGLAAP